MVYISTLTQASVLISSKNVHLRIKVMAKDTNNISCTVSYGFGEKAQLVRYLPCMQIFVMWAQASWRLTVTSRSGLMFCIFVGISIIVLSDNVM